MLFDNQNPFAGAKRPEDVLACYWYNMLWNKAISLYKWEGPAFEGPNATLNADYLEWALMSQGQACFLFDKNKKLRGLVTTRVGLDPYGFPTTFECSNPVLGTLKGTQGVNAVWVRNNKFAIPVTSTIKYYATQLAKILTSLNVSLSNNRMTKMFFADNPEQANQIRKMVDDVDAGKLAVVVLSGLAEQILGAETGTRKVPVYSTPSEYLADKYMQDMRTVIDDFYTTFGINASGANMIKKERNTTAEVESNNEQIGVNAAYWLEPRQQAAQLASELFNTEIKVSLRQENTDIAEGEGMLSGLRQSESSDE